jgi:hypothetical protein
MCVKLGRLYRMLQYIFGRQYRMLQYMFGRLYHMLQYIFGSKRPDVAELLRKLHNDELHN